ncbi:MAG: alanine--tRNA ligase [Candidatus Doudnabacteria bacterium]|nr:alanine--tRNA ligase [Candidatus Doudnabacteria bacterium]
MTSLSAKDIRQKYLDFFKERGHAIIASASLVPENDPSVLFTTAGMHPLVPYLMGEAHPDGKRLANVQKCVRTQDIEEVGDDTHDTFFEMLGNWSLGDYFKEESIRWSFEFLTSPAYLNIPIEKLAVTVFAGDNDAPRDEESASIWKSLGVPESHIFYLGKEDNWWGPPGKTGPCGPDTEIFYDRGNGPLNGDGPDTEAGRFVEIWNNVFMQYEKLDDGSFKPLAQKNVDTGMGLERIAMALQGRTHIFETDLFADAYNKVKELALVEDEEAVRVVTDHLRTAMFMLGDGVRPSNVDQGYILRRLIRRAVRFAAKLQIPEEVNVSKEVVEVFFGVYEGVYPELEQHREVILEELRKEEEKFEKTLDNGLRHLKKEIEKLQQHAQTAGSDLIAGSAKQPTLPGDLVFDLYQTYGFPLELTFEEAEKMGFGVNEEEFQQNVEQHQSKSREGAAQKFAGGLSEDTPETRMGHTATHLLHKVLRDVLGDHVEQKGSNITPERVRFDFSHPDKMTPEQIAEVERIINDVIERDLPVTWETLSLEEARAKGALGLFEDKYGDQVKVYSVGDFSVEVCGGPHVENTSEIGAFVISKEQASSAGIRRIKAYVGEKAKEVLASRS